VSGVLERRGSPQAWQLSAQLRAHCVGARLRAAFVVVVVVILTSPARDTYAQPVSAATAPVLRDLHGIDELRSRFDGDQGKVRIVLLLSPT
jgi:hypothetical protein